MLPMNRTRPPFLATEIANDLRYDSRAVEQIVAGERGIAPFSTSFIRRGLNAARPRHLNSTVGPLVIIYEEAHTSGKERAQLQA
jgi:hypothetical protein